MIVCDYVDESVKRFLHGKSGNVVLTFFKEPFNNYKKNNVVFIDDVLDEDDYNKIDIFVNKVMKDVDGIFSKYLEVDMYKLFDYLKLQAKLNLGKIYKFKYCIDKILTKKDSTILYFSSELVLLILLEQDYAVKNLCSDISGLKMKYRKWKKYFRFVKIIYGKYFIKNINDNKKKSKNILWMAGRSIDSLLISELNKNNKILLLQPSGYKISFAKKKYKCNLLKLKKHKLFKKKWNYLKNQYNKGLNEIALEIKLNPELIEIIFRIDRYMIKGLLLILSILEDNKNMINLLIVEQSVIGQQALAVDFFSGNRLPSIEVLHGVPSDIEVGKTDKIAVYGKRDKSFLSSYGVDESKIKITGCAYYDKIINIKDEEKKYDFLLLILDWIAYVPSKNSHEIIYKQVITMLKLIQHFQDEKLIIKLHPGQSMKEVEYICHLIKNMMYIKNRVEVVKDVNAFNLLRDAKIIYNNCSSVGVEALLMKKPLIVLDSFSHRTIDYEKYGGCLVAKNYKELLLATEEILKDVHGYLKKNKRNIEKTRGYFSGDLKGESYKNVARAINETLYK